MESWAERYVDKQVDRAWLEFRMDLAERFAAGLAEPPLDLEVSAPDNEMLAVLVNDGLVSISTREQVSSFDNVDAAAYEVYRVLHEEWQVVHPVFLGEDLEVPAPAESKVRSVAVPVLGVAESRDQLRSWVVATFQAIMSEPLVPAEGGRLFYRTRGGHKVTLSVPNSCRVQISAVLARNVSPKRARRLIDDLSEDLFALKFSLRQDTLMMTQIVVAEPYAGDQVLNALRAFSRDLDRLAEWVPEKLLRRRARLDRRQVERTEAARKSAEEVAARACEERDAAQYELEVLRHRLQRLLGDQPTLPFDDPRLEDFDFYRGGSCD